MAQLMLIDDDPGTLTTFGMILRTAGHEVLTAESGVQALALLNERPVDLVLSDLRLPDMSGIEVVRHLRSRRPAVAVVVVTGFGSTQDVVTAMRLGAADFLEKPVFEDGLLRAVEEVLGPRHAEDASMAEALDDEEPIHREAHAAARWARAIAPVIEAPSDPRTITGWGRLTCTSPGALRNWCRTAGIPPRRSLVFARLLRAVLLASGGRHRLENVLDVVDLRTLGGLLKMGGLDPKQELPGDVETFLQRQTLVRDSDALAEIRRVLRLRAQRPRAPRRLRW